jgi:hypothetical protein
VGPIRVWFDPGTPYSDNNAISGSTGGELRKFQERYFLWLQNKTPLLMTLPACLVFSIKGGLRKYGGKPSKP